MVTSPENYLLCQRGRIWGDERSVRLAKIQSGDLLIFYITKIHELGMLALVSGSMYSDTSPFWPDRAYPYRIGFLPLAEPTTGLPLQPFPNAPLANGRLRVGSAG